MKKIIVIGCPGSGKSTFARVLHNKTGIPLYHLDLMYWNADKTTVKKECVPRTPVRCTRKRRVDHRRQLRLNDGAANGDVRYGALSRLSA